MLLLAGYSARHIAYGAARALRRRGCEEGAQGLLREWIGQKVLRDWSRAIRAARAGPNERAFVQRALAHRDALVVRGDRAQWAADVSNGLIQPRVDQGTPIDGSGCAARGKVVRFAL